FAAALPAAPLCLGPQYLTYSCRPRLGRRRPARHVLPTCGLMGTHGIHPLPSVSSSRKRHLLQLRVEAYRVLNHPVFAAPGATAGNSALGTINAAANRFRTLQLGARIVMLSGS